MKKHVFVAMAAMISMAWMTGCSGGESKETVADTKAESSGTVAAAEETEKAGDGSEAEATVSAVDVDPESRLGKILASGKITMGTAPDFAPMEFKNVGAKGVEYVGSDIELGKYIAEKLGVELEIKAMEFSAIQQGLASGTIDMGISGFAYTEERAETLGLSDRYNIQSEDKGHTLLVLKEDAASYKTAEDFSGKKVVAQNASLQQSLVTEQLPSDIQFQPVTAITDGVLMLTTGKADALAVSYDNGEMLMKSYPEIAMTEFKFDHSDEGNVIAVKKGEDELLEALNGIIAEVNESGLYSQWTEEARALAESLGIEMK